MQENVLENEIIELDDGLMKKRNRNSLSKSSFNGSIDANWILPKSK